MTLVDVIDAMKAVGCSLEQVVAVSGALDLRSTGAKRQARYRERRNENVTKRNALRKRDAQRRVCSRLPEDFRPSLTMRAYAKGKGLADGQIDAEGEAMRDWSLASEKGKKLDWEATWRTWVNRKLEPKGNGAEPPPRTLSPQGYVRDSSKPGGINFLAEPRNRRF